MTSDLAELSKGIERLRAARSEAGLDPDALRVRANAPVVEDTAGRPDLEATVDRLDELRAVGVTVAAFALPRFVYRAKDVPGFLEKLGRLA